MSVVGEGVGPSSDVVGGGVLQVWSMGVLYHLTYPMMHVMLPTPSPCEQTDACEIITFPKLRLRAVIITSYNEKNIAHTIVHCNLD